MKNHDFLHRYSRQINLESVGVEGQERLRDSRVLIVGAGGLGAPVSLYLAAAGVGTLGIIDPDYVDQSNLQRQILFDSTDQGRPKVEVAKARLEALNPECRVKVFQDYFQGSNAESLLSDYDLIIDGSDNFSTKFLVCDVAHKLNKPMVYGAVDQFEGQVGIFHSHEESPIGSCYRCLFPKEPQARIRNCAEAGVIGSIVGVIGSLQASLAIHWIIAGGSSTHPLFPPLGKIMLFKLDAFETFQFQIGKKSDCPTCSKEPADIILKFEAPVCDAQFEIDWSDVKKQLEHTKAILVDVREQGEWAAGHLPGAYHWPLSQIQNGRLPEPAWFEDSNFRDGKTDDIRPTVIFFYCQKGLRSLEAIRSLKSIEKVSMYSVRGGLQELEFSDWSL